MRAEGRFPDCQSGGISIITVDLGCVNFKIRSPALTGQIARIDANGAPLIVISSLPVWRRKYGIRPCNNTISADETTNSRYQRDALRLGSNATTMAPALADSCAF